MIKNGDTVQSPRIFGLVLIVVGLLVNEWFVAIVFSPHGSLNSTTWRLAIWLIDIVFILTGILIAIGKIRTPRVPLVEVLLVTITTLIMLVVLEGGARLWLQFMATAEQYSEYELVSRLPAEALNSSPHHYMGYMMNPGYRRGELSHNSMGYRDREFSIKKPDGTYRIVALGGSTTYTAGVEDNAKTYPTQLERELRNEYGYGAVEVINGGNGGHSSFETLINLHFRVLDLQPDMVIIYHGTNDVHPRFVQPDLYRGDNSARRKYWQIPTTYLIDRSTFMRILRRHLRLSGQIGVSSIVDAPTALYMKYFKEYVEGSTLRDPMDILDENPPIYFRRNLRSMAAIARTAGVTPVLATWAYSPHCNDYAATPHYQRGFRENNEVVREVAREFDIPMFDFAAVMPTDPAYWSDGRHVNEEGALLKAQLFAEFLNASGLIPTMPKLATAVVPLIQERAAVLPFEDPSCSKRH